MTNVGRSSSPPPRDPNLTLRRLIPGGIRVPDVSFLADPETVKKVKDYIEPAFLVLGSFYCFTNNYRLAFIAGAVVAVVCKQKKEELNKWMQMASIVLPLDKESIWSPFFSTEKSMPEEKANAAKNLLLMVLIANLVSTRFVKGITAGYVGFTATRTIYG